MKGESLYLLLVFGNFLFGFFLDLLVPSNTAFKIFDVATPKGEVLFCLQELQPIFPRLHRVGHARMCCHPDPLEIGA